MRKPKQDIHLNALNQNLTTLRNRINELGVAEAWYKAKGQQPYWWLKLPGVQDTAEAKLVVFGRILQTLNSRLVSDLNDNILTVSQVKYNGQPLPPGTEVFAYESLDSGRELLLNRSPKIVGGAEVNITLDTAGGKLMSDATRTAVGKRNGGFVY
ncbi:hypothetical protein FQA39_LY19221 [Lamprigera yunnana]|nr:hypothetical protein FQA39_LY19221 [Lamprigera yunnana]